jgi:hypothetical protein
MKTVRARSSPGEWIAVASASTSVVVAALYSAGVDNRPRGKGGCAQARLEQEKGRGKGVVVMGATCIYSGAVGE